MKITVKPKNKLDLSSLKIAILAGISNFLVTFFYASRLNVWGDEAFSIQATKLSYAKMIELTAKDNHPPLYYILLKAWSKLFGYNELGLRVMSMFFMVLAVIVLVLISYRYFNKKAAVITGILLGLSPFAIRMGLEIRMYSMAFLFCSLFLWAYLEYRNSQKKMLIFLMGLLGALAMYTHYFSVFMIITVLIVDYISLRGESTKIELVRFLKKSALVKAGVVSFILYLPWIGVFLSRAETLNNAFWVPKPMLTSPLYTPLNFLFGIDEYFLWGKPALYISLTALAVIIFKFKPLKQSLAKLDANSQFFSLIFIIPVALMMLISLDMPTSIYYSRYLGLNAFISFAVLFPAFLASRKNKSLIYLSLACLIVGNIYLWFYGNTRILAGNQTTAYSAKSVLQCSLRPDKPNIFLVDDQSEYLIVNYYLDDALGAKSDNYKVYYLTNSDDELKGYNAWIDAQRYRGAFQSIPKSEVADRLNFEDNNVWYVSPANPKFSDPKSQFDIYKSFKPEKVCQSNRKLLTGYDSDKAYLLSPIER
jgi:hypothetical protein